MRSRSHHHQILRTVKDCLTSDLSPRLMMVTSDNAGTNAGHLWLFSDWIRSLLGSVRSEEHLVILPDFTSEELGKALQVLQFSQQDTRLFNGVTKDILEILGLDMDKYELDGSESHPEMEMEKIKNKEAGQGSSAGFEIEIKVDPTDSLSDDSDSTLQEVTKNVKNDERDNDEDDTDQDIQNLLMMANTNLSDSESDEEEETVDKDKMYLGVHNFLLQDQNLDDTDSDSNEENIQTENNQPRLGEEDWSDGNISAKIDEEIKNLLEKSAEGYNCKVCGKTGRLRLAITRHIETHLEGFCHPCNQCKAVMPTRNARVQHIRLKHKNKNKK